MNKEYTHSLQISDRDHTYLLTEDDIYFCVGGNLHSQGYIFGMPYYFLTKELEEIMDITINEHIVINSKKFSKILGQIPLSDYKLFIKDNYPEYFYSPSLWEVLMKVDRTKVRQVLDPRSYVNKISREYILNSDEENGFLYTLYKLLERGNMLISNVGVSGSLLLTEDLKQFRNDIDLVFYKRDSVEAVKDFSVSVRQSDPRFSGLSEQALSDYVKKKKSRFNTPEDQIVRMVQGRWDTIFIDGIKLDFTFNDDHPPSIPSYEMEIKERIQFQAKVTGISDSYFLPTQLLVDNERYQEIIITARGYICLFNFGDIVNVTGWVYSSKENGREYVVIDENKGSISLE